MSGEAGATGAGTSTTATTQQSGTPIPVLQGDAPTKMRSPKEQSDALDARLATRRAEAEGRDEGGRFLPKQDGAKVDAKFADEKKAAPEAKKTDEKKTDADGEHAKLKTEHERVKAEHASATKALEQAKKDLASWDETAEKVYARMERDKATIAHLQAELAKAKVQVDPRVLENLTLQEQINARNLADERAAAQRAEQEKAQQTAAKAAELTGLRASLRATLDAHPELQPPFTEQTAEAGVFWQSVQDAIKNGATLAQVRPLLATAALVAEKIKAKTPPTPPPRTLRSAASGGGEPKPKDRGGYLDKWHQKLAAAGR